MSYKGPSSINGVSISIYVIMIALVYGGWRYLPVMWEREEVSYMISEILDEADKMNDIALREEIHKRMVKEFGVEGMPIEDVEVYRSPDGNWVTGVVYYYVLVNHPLNYTHELLIKVSSKRRVIEF